MEIENNSLKQELRNIKLLMAEVQEELKEFRNELTGELKNILMNYAGSAFGVFDLAKGTVSTFADVITLIPGIGKIAGALKLLKLVYNAYASPAKAIKKKIKADKIKKTIDKLEKLKDKLNSIA